LQQSLWLWFTEVVRKPVRADGQEVGRIEDAVVQLEEAAYPIVTGVLVEINGVSVFVSVDKITDLGAETVETTQSIESFGPFERRPQEILIGRDLLEHHLIWAKSRLRAKMVTARDVALFPLQGQWRVLAIDAARAHRSKFLPRRDRTLQVDWLELVPLVGHVPTARRRLELRSIRRLHPAELADLLESASASEGEEILGALANDPEFEADVVEELNPSRQQEAIRNRSDAEIGELLAEMEPDDAVDLLLGLEQERRSGVLAAIPEPAKSSVLQLLRYHPGSAGGLMTTDVVTLAPELTGLEACELLRAREELPHNLWTIFLVDEHRHLVGQLGLASLLSGDLTQPISSLADLDPQSVRPDADLAEIALRMADYNLVALAVTDDEGVLLGAVTIDDVLPRTISPAWRRRQEALEG